MSARLRVDDGAPCLVYDFGTVSGHASLRREIALDYPDNYAFTLRRRGSGPANAFQFKLVDASGENVWWVNRPDTSFTRDWEPLEFRRRHIEFAWGPAADKVLRRSAAIEFTVYAGQGGRGELCVADLALHERPADGPWPPPVATATAQQRRAPAAFALDGDRRTAWRASARRETQFVVDFGRPREFGGLLLHWLPGAGATDYLLERSDDAQAWQPMRRVEHGNGGGDALWLPESDARYLRLTLQRGQGKAFGLAEFVAVDVADGSTLTRFLQRSARDLPRGSLPRGFHNEQSYWTLVGVDGGAQSALIGEDGAIELARGDVSIEPFLLDEDGSVVSWADVEIAQSLAEGYLPLPRVSWRWRGISLSIDAFATGDAKDARLHARYTLKNDAAQTRRVRLVLALRPFQVNPPTQFLTTPGGTASIREVGWMPQSRALLVDEKKRVFALTRPATGFVSDFARGFAETRFRESPLPSSVSARDADGLASAALLYEAELPAGLETTVGLVAPLAGHPEIPSFDTPSDAEAWLQQQYEASAAQWRRRLDRVELIVPPQGQALADSVRSSLAHILLSRDGPRLRPGTRSYARSWIRDGAMIAEGLLRLGDTTVARDYLAWYASYQFDSGKVPCCVDARGADPVPENDSHGELIHLAALLWRYGGDAEAVRGYWPRIRAAVAYMDGLRASERDAARDAPERRAFSGLMPASISHEGYSAKPMHSYWDDFWALTGYKDAAALAQALGLRDEARRIAASRDEFRRDIHASIERATATHGIGYLPGAAELGDFDPTSTTIALSPAGEQAALPPALLQGTFERYWNEFVARRDGTRAWKDYTPYEWRNVSALVRLGRRERAWQAVEFFMADRRPAPWNQWAEVVGREPREPRFIGDMPHAWVSSDFIRAALDLFAYERYEQQALVLAAGIPAEWLAGKGVAIRGLRTPYGTLSYALWRDRVGITLTVDGAGFAPPGGVRLPWPIDGTPGATTINGKPAQWKEGELKVSEFPARVEIRRVPPLR
ncbi:MAG TPA: discoidin domain-containing protein [Tahibacter sp.]|nr:discoidin domain-containing protein [Tahibacter sp.]HSX61825.1 discoidin domain-containing protein [Tahibacter sp.]